MMDFKLTILGSNSAFPAYGRYPTAQVLQYFNQYFLIDSGEGTQLRLSENKIKKSKIDQIFISHLHGDHVFGLPGLVTSYAQLGRTRPLYIYGPTGIREMMDAILRLSGSRVEFVIEYHELDHEDSIQVFENEYLTVRSFPLDHRVPTYGYRFDEKKSELRFDKEMLKKYALTTEQILDVKSGIDIDWNGQTLAPEMFTLPPTPLRSYAYCSDTAYTERILDYISQATLLYHEATFAADRKDLADWSRHSTTIEAGQIAHKAGVRTLVIGHYSSRYKDLEPLLSETKTEFSNAHLAREGKVFEIR